MTPTLTAAAPAKTVLPVLLGTMTFTRADHAVARISDAAQVKRLYDVLATHGHRTLDTARIYGGGSTEELLTAAGWQQAGMKVHTKVYPTKGKPMGWLTKEEYTLGASDVRASLMGSLKALGDIKDVDLFYLHGPDRNTPWIETLAELDALYRQGCIKRIGLSNFTSWEVAGICELCRANGWLQPTVYQGVYNALHRGVEPELLPCLRHYGLALYAFQPLAGGLLAGKYTRDTTDFHPGSRYDPKTAVGAVAQKRYFNDAAFAALDVLRAACASHHIPMSEAAHRWLMHHSALKPEYGDVVIIGVSSEKQLEQNLRELEKGPLPDNVVEAFATSHNLCRSIFSQYWH